MNKRLRHILKSLFHLGLQRSLFTRKSGRHARDRFFSRYRVRLSPFDYELMNLKLLLGHYEILNESTLHTSFYKGEFKGITFFAIFDLMQGNIVTFLTEEMSNAKIQARPLSCDLPIIRLEQLQKFKLIYFDSHENLSIYRLSLRKNFIYSHAENKVLAIVPTSHRTLD